jgi:predicted GTPase
MWESNESQRHHNQNIRRGSEQTFQRSLSANNIFPYQPITGFEPLNPSHDSNTVQQIFIAEPDEDPMQHLVIVPLGKTGAGKSSLLNIMLGYDEFKAKAAAKVYCKLPN